MGDELWCLRAIRARASDRIWTLNELKGKLRKQRLILD